jgi:hypothetical protein
VLQIFLLEPARNAWYLWSRFRSERSGLFQANLLDLAGIEFRFFRDGILPYSGDSKMIDLSEKLHTVKEVAYILRCSYDTARRDFLKEEGVLERSNTGARKRLYRQILIPESVLLRVVRKRERRPASFRSAA